MTSPILAGHTPTAARLNALGAVLSAKTADQTVINSTTFVSDTELFLSVAANAVYILDGVIVYQSGTTPDWKMRWTYPTGLTMTYTMLAQVTTFTAFVFSETGIPVNDGTGGTFACTLQGTVTTSSTAGTLQLQWAQNTANASNTLVRVGSYLSLSRVV